MQYGHIYAAICIMTKLKVMFRKLYTRIYFNVGTFKWTIFLPVSLTVGRAENEMKWIGL